MKFDTIQFLIFCVIAITLLNIRWVSQGVRSIFLCGLNIYFVSSFVSEPLQLMPLFMFVCGSYLAILLISRIRLGSVGIAILLFSILMVFALLKRYSIVSFLPFSDYTFLTVGLSYILFRIIHLLVDVAQGAIRIPSPVVYFNYIFFFLTFLSGPIQRFQDFAAESTKPKVFANAPFINLALKRIIKGYFMISIVCLFTAHTNERFSHYFYSAFSAGLSLKTIILYSGLAFSQLSHLYFNFAGYMHICIGIGCLLGYVIPENFDQPYKATSFLNLWSRWHITLGQWFKTYLFNPTMKALCARWQTPQIFPYLSAFAFFLTFLIMGIWHGTTALFVFYGFLLAFGVTINKLWQIQATKWYGKKKYKDLCQQTWYIYISSGATISFFAISLTCLWIDPTHIYLIFSLQGLLCTFLAFFLLLGVLTAIRVFFGRICNYIPKKLILISSGGLADTVWISLMIFVLVNMIVVIGDGAPEFVYKGF